MNGSKNWWQSEGVWGGLAALLAGVAGMMGWEIGATEINDMLLSAMALIGGVLAIIGRIKATSKIS